MKFSDPNLVVPQAMVPHEIFGSLPEVDTDIFFIIKEAVEQQRLPWKHTFDPMKNRETLHIELPDEPGGYIVLERRPNGHDSLVLAKLVLSGTRAGQADVRLWKDNGQRCLLEGDTPFEIDLSAVYQANFRTLLQQHADFDAAIQMIREVPPWEWDLRVQSSYPEDGLRVTSTACYEREGVSVTLSRVEMFTSDDEGGSKLESSAIWLGYGRSGVDWHESNDPALCADIKTTMQRLDAYRALQKALKEKPIYRWLLGGSIEYGSKFITFHLVDEEVNLQIQQSEGPDGTVEHELLYHHPHMPHGKNEEMPIVNIQGTVIGQHFSELHSKHELYSKSPKGLLRASFMRGLKDITRKSETYENPSPGKPEKESILIALDRVNLMIERTREKPQEDWRYSVDPANNSHPDFASIGPADFDEQEAKWFYTMAKNLHPDEEMDD